MRENLECFCCNKCESALRYVLEAALKVVSGTKMDSPLRHNEEIGKVGIIK